MSRVAILGGTFNPIHNGHLYLAKECAKILDFGQVLLMPTAIPPHKTTERASFQRRPVGALPVGGSRRSVVSGKRFGDEIAAAELYLPNAAGTPCAKAR